MNITQIIDKKRRGLTHTQEEIDALVQMMQQGRARDYQISAWLMAACIQGLNLEETTWLTQAFVDSGKKLDLSKIDGVVVDKHSTGGVGDKTTLALIPMLAACGVKVAKLSGRGLGFTGGTIDKLEAIPNFKVSLSGKEFLRQVQEIGMAISSQTEDLAPADGRMYALRDVTATVDSLPLIVASVVSKKIAASADVIVLDIKYGSGAFMKTLGDAKELAAMCREVGSRLGKSISTVISSMEQPLGMAIGHTLEVMETINMLRGKGPADLELLCLKLGGVALVCAGLHPTVEEAEKALKQCLDSGAALEKFRELVVAQGGDPYIIEDPALMPQPQRITIVPAPKTGYVASVDSLKIAQAAKEIGAGRLTKESHINLGVGVLLHKKVGDFIEQGDALVELWVGERSDREARLLLEEAITLSDEPVTPKPLIEEVVLGDIFRSASKASS